VLKLKKISEVFGMQVFTDSGEYFGNVEELIIQDNKIFGWKIKATKGSLLAKAIGGAKGVIVPHSLIRAIGDIVLISKSAIPSLETEEKKLKLEA